MNQSPSKNKWLICGALAIAGAIIIPTFILVQFKRWTHPQPPLPLYGQIADFTLTNQNGNQVSLTDLRGRVWVADIIFTRCASSCPQMTYKMKLLQQALDGDAEVKLITLTTDPQFDTPPVLKRYAERFGADPKRWIFLTGAKPQIANLAVGSLKLSAVAKQSAERLSPDDLFIHSTLFVLVGKHGQLRGIFETTGDGVDFQQVKPSILKAISRLERES